MDRQAEESEFFIGLMSGTSMDGIDAALVEFRPSPDDQGGRIELIAALCHPLDTSLVRALQDLVETGDTSLKRLGQLDAQLGQCFADAAAQLLKKSSLPAARISAIGSHGQTIWHDVGATDKQLANSMQIADPNRIAQQTGITTVADFRRRDIAAGGQGAPLVPAFHAAYFATDQEDRITLNIGGIANIALLPRDQGAPILGCDTGPGNCLLDRWIQRHHNKKYDAGGEWARAGTVNHPLLDALLADPYFSQESPKSTGTDYFSIDWLLKRLSGLDEPSPEDVQCTLVELTARSIRDTCLDMMPNAQAIYVCGGGAQNAYLMERLARLVDPIRVETTASLGIDPDWVEAMAFAWIARETLANRAANCPSVTGASQPVVLGAIYPAFSRK